MLAAGLEEAGQRERERALVLQLVDPSHLAVQSALRALEGGGEGPAAALNQTGSPLQTSGRRVAGGGAPEDDAEEDREDEEEEDDEEEGSIGGSPGGLGLGSVRRARASSRASVASAPAAGSSRGTAQEGGRRGRTPSLWARVKTWWNRPVTPSPPSSPKGGAGRSSARRRRRASERRHMSPHAGPLGGLVSPKPYALHAARWKEQAARAESPEHAEERVEGPPPVAVPQTEPRRRPWEEESGKEGLAAATVPSTVGPMRLARRKRSISAAGRRLLFSEAGAGGGAAASASAAPRAAAAAAAATAAKEEGAPWWRLDQGQVDAMCSSLLHVKSDYFGGDDGDGNEEEEEEAEERRQGDAGGRKRHERNLSSSAPRAQYRPPRRAAADTTWRDVNQVYAARLREHARSTSGPVASAVAPRGAVYHSEEQARAHARSVSQPQQRQRKQGSRAAAPAVPPPALRQPTAPDALSFWMRTVIPKWDVVRGSPLVRKIWDRDGVPPELRGAVWPLAVGARRPGLTDDTYADALAEAERLGIQGTIDSEVERSVSSEAHAASVRRVLGAFAAHCPDLSYVQGMTYVAALFLDVMRPPAAFRCLVSVLDADYFAAYVHFDVEEVRLRLRIFEAVFRANLPRLFRKFRQVGIPPDAYVIDHMMTLFTRAVPLRTAARVFDAYLLHGEIVVFRGLVALVKLLRHRLWRATPTEAISLLRGMHRIDDDLMVRAMRSITIPRRVAAYYRQRAREAGDAPAAGKPAGVGGGRASAAPASAAAPASGKATPAGGVGAAAAASARAH